MAREIFISYSRRNLVRVKKVKAEIEAATGADCWMDLDGIESGSPQFDEVIVKGINESRIFLFMLSEHSQKSEFAINELELARRNAGKKQDRKVVLVNIDDSEMIDTFFLRYNRMDIIVWSNDAQRDKLIRDLRRWTDYEERQAAKLRERERVEQQRQKEQVRVKEDAVKPRIKPAVEEKKEATERKKNWYGDKRRLTAVSCAFAVLTFAIIVFARGCSGSNVSVQTEAPVGQPSVYYANNTLTVNGVEYQMVYVEGGTFKMGSEKGNALDKPVHNVTLNSYYIGKTEVTQALWEVVMGITVEQQRDKADPSWELPGVGGSYPMYFVSWDECQEFVERLSEMTGKEFRLPTEAEWEFAAKGGIKSKGYTYSGSNDIGRVAWYNGNSLGKTHPVGTKASNELGIYDMSGNVREWCQDRDGRYDSAAQTNPSGSVSGHFRINRGGGWFNDETYCCTASRNCDIPTDFGRTIGLRLALSE